MAKYALEALCHSTCFNYAGLIVKMDTLSCRHFAQEFDCMFFVSFLPMHICLMSSYSALII